MNHHLPDFLSYSDDYANLNLFAIAVAMIVEFITLQLSQNDTNDNKKDLFNMQFCFE